MRSTRHILIILGCLALFTAAFEVMAQKPLVDNPAYLGWKDFKPGSFARHKSVTRSGDNSSEMMITSSLVQIDGGKAVVEIQTVLTMGDETQLKPSQKITHQARIADPGRTQMLGTGKGREVVEVNGEKLNTSWSSNSSVRGIVRTATKVWQCPDVPGGKVKSEMSIRTENTVTTTSLMLQDYKAVK